MRMPLFTKLAAHRGGTENHRLMAHVRHERLPKVELMETANLIVLDKTRASRRAEVG